MGDWVLGLSKKPSSTKVESFAMTIADINQTYDVVLTENCSTWTYFAFCLLYIWINTWERLQSYVKCQDIEGWRRLGRVTSQKLLSIDNHGQLIW